ncbi:MAG: helicase-associated domain-containing protein, partial [Treponema sp.]|nr:helicase-associated domain-containing protein [Treponema sp.]
MAVNPEKPLIVQSDRTLLLDVHAAQAEEARAAILPFAELEKSPEHIHTYHITPLSLWNAASAGFTPEDVTRVLNEYTRYPIPSGITEGFGDVMSRYGKIRLVSEAQISTADPGTDTVGEMPTELLLTASDKAVLAEIAAAKRLEKYLVKNALGFTIHLTDRGSVKRELIRMGWPVQDEAPFVQGEALDIALRETSVSGRPFTPRDYQQEAARSVLGTGGPGTGYGVVVMPCGSGKTIVGM